MVALGGRAVSYERGTSVHWVRTPFSASVEALERCAAALSSVNVFPTDLCPVESSGAEVGVLAKLAQGLSQSLITCGSLMTFGPLTTFASSR